MRTVFNPAMMLGQTAIEDIQLDASCRDDIPAVLKGIQHIWCNHRLRERVCALLEEHLLATGASATKGDAAQTEDRAPVPGINPDVGRPGMELWRVLVLGLLKQGINCDYDRLHDLANQHGDVRRMLGISDVLGAETFSYRTLARNVALLTPELLAAVNRLAVEAGHELAGCRPDEPLQARCDSFTVETDVHYPTDVNLLWDALRCLIRVLALACEQCGLGGWRQSAHLTWKVRGLFNRVRSSKRRKNQPQRVQDYVRQARRIAERAQESLEELAGAGADAGILSEIKYFLDHAERQIEQVERRLLRGETIPQEAKVFGFRAAHALVCEGQGRAAGGTGGASGNRGKRARVRAALQDHVDGTGRGGGAAVGAGDASAVSGAGGMQFRQGLPQPGEPGGVGQGTGIERAAAEGEAVAGGAGAGGGGSLRGGAADASGGGICDSQPGVPGIGPGAVAGAGGLCASGRAVGAGVEHRIADPAAVLALNLHRIGLILQRRRERLKRARQRRLRLAA